MPTLSLNGGSNVASSNSKLMTEGNVALNRTRALNCTTLFSLYGAETISREVAGVQARKLPTMENDGFRLVKFQMCRSWANLLDVEGKEVCDDRGDKVILDFPWNRTQPAQYINFTVYTNGNLLHLGATVRIYRVEGRFYFDSFVYPLREFTEGTLSLSVFRNVDKWVRDTVIGMFGHMNALSFTDAHTFYTDTVRKQFIGTQMFKGADYQLLTVVDYALSVILLDLRKSFEDWMGDENLFVDDSAWSKEVGKWCFRNGITKASLGY